MFRLKRTSALKRRRREANAIGGVDALEQAVPAGGENLLFIIILDLHLLPGL